MTRDDIIRMAREAGHAVRNIDGEDEVMDGDNYHIQTELIESFAVLVAAAEREECAKLVWPTQEVKVWSDNELEAMTGAFNQAQEKHGWYETIMAVGATALKARAAAIRARGEK